MSNFQTFIENFTKWYNSPSVALTVKSITAGVAHGDEVLYARLLSHIVPRSHHLCFVRDEDHELRVATIVEPDLVASPKGVLEGEEFQRALGLPKGAVIERLTARDIESEDLPQPSSDGYALRAGFARLLQDARVIPGLDQIRQENGGTPLPNEGLTLAEVFERPITEIENFFQWHFGSDEALGVLIGPEACTVLPDGDDFGRCTNSANWMSSLVNGETLGFLVDDNPSVSDRMIDVAGGHDFTVVEDRFVIDLWNAIFVGNRDSKGAPDPIVFDLEAPAQACRIKELYGEKGHWSKLNTGPRIEPPLATPA